MKSNFLSTLLPSALSVMFLLASPILKAADAEAYVFTYFNTGPEGQSQGLQYAYSRDGYQWQKIESPEGTFLRPEVGGKLLRDPSIVEGPDGTFHMVWTTDWWHHGIGIAHSNDLINWSKQEYLDVMENFPGYTNCWAPEIFYDEITETYLIFWASTIPGKFPGTEGKGETFTKPAVKGVKASHRMYLTTTKDFKTYSPTELFYDDGYNCIDAFIVRDEERERYVMVLKDEEKFPEPRKDLRIAFAESPFGPWGESSDPISPHWVEGQSLLKVGDEWLLYFDAYTRKVYEGLKTRDFENWTSITEQLVVPEGMRHGTPFPVSEKILAGLIAAGSKDSSKD
ncbi:MAG: glycoside hydrolase family 43 protein [Verrucomicrobiales bacterium]|nr:glycoside hydrolase family 43 protein [Verrucomicrobiales bacterium]